MKKVFVFALMVALVVSLAIPGAAAALKSAGATVEDLKPFLVESTCDDAVILSLEEIEELPEEAQEIFAEAKEALAEAVPEGMAVRYLLHLDVCETCGKADVELQMGDHDEIVVMMFIDGEWIEVEFTVNADGTITVVGAVDGPIAIFVK